MTRWTIALALLIIAVIAILPWDDGEVDELLGEWIHKDIWSPVETS